MKTMCGSFRSAMFTISPKLIAFITSAVFSSFPSVKPPHHPKTCRENKESKGREMDNEQIDSDGSSGGQSTNAPGVRRTTSKNLLLICAPDNNEQGHIPSMKRASENTSQS